MGVIHVLFGLLSALAWANGQQQEFALNQTFALTGTAWQLAWGPELIQGNLLMVSDPISGPEYALKAALSPTFSQTSSVQVSSGESFGYSRCSDGTYAYFGRYTS